MKGFEPSTDRFYGLLLYLMSYISDGENDGTRTRGLRLSPAL